jgi:hypothetical protein
MYRTHVLMHFHIKIIYNLGSKPAFCVIKFVPFGTGTLFPKSGNLVPDPALVKFHPILTTKQQSRM